MGTAGLRATQGRPGMRSIDEAQAAMDKSQDPVAQRVFKRTRVRYEQQEQERAAAAALSAAERASQEKTASLAASAGGGVAATTNGRGSNTYIEGNPGQADNQSQGDVDLSTSDTTLRRRGGYRRDSGIRI